MFNSAGIFTSKNYVSMKKQVKDMLKNQFRKIYSEKF